MEISPAAEVWLTDSETGLIETGAVDSVNIIEIIALLEKRYNFIFNIVDLKAEHFQNLGSLLELLEKKYNFEVF